MNHDMENIRHKIDVKEMKYRKADCKRKS